ncbi:hypothetical protein L596_019324 [Steinernema carpocapsae]|uniref:Serpin domain-containing protein n=1 Tax=Steinernema carpocapsae TaxID=34508 RepID=A0A4U5MQQ7_STECR|nr:hypothetical protein L596_019324 [Steinernema carpocapsae]
MNSKKRRTSRTSKLPPEPKKPKRAFNSIKNAYVDSFAHLALKLLNTKNKESSVTSPYSICLMMATAGVGARGRTQQEIFEAIINSANIEAASNFFGESFEELTELRVASAVFVDQHCTLKDNYKNQLKQHYSTNLQSADFSKNAARERKRINAFIEEKTNGQIQNLIPSVAISDETRFVLANAVYLTAHFDDIFDEEYTKLRTFHGESRRKTKVLTMEGMIEAGADQNVPAANPRKLLTSFFHYLDFFIGKDQKYRFFIFLPVKKVSCARLRAELLGENSLNFSEIFNKAEPIQEAWLEIPKFKTEANFDLVPFLESCGVLEAFKPSADFSGITDEPLQLGFAGHKAMFEMNEKGITASAASYCTSIPISGSLMRKHFKMIANRPFLYGICCNGLPLFLGQYY